MSLYFDGVTKKFSFIIDNMQERGSFVQHIKIRSQETAGVFFARVKKPGKFLVLHEHPGSSSWMAELGGMYNLWFLEEPWLSWETEQGQPAAAD